jgi:hypothetical protein
MKRYHAANKLLSKSEEQAEDRAEWIVTFLNECLENWEYSQRKFEAAIGEINYLSAKAGGYVFFTSPDTGKMTMYGPRRFYERADAAPDTLPESLFSLTPDRRFWADSPENDSAPWVSFEKRQAGVWRSPDERLKTMQWRGACFVRAYIYAALKVTAGFEEELFKGGLPPEERAALLRLGISASLVGQAYCSIKRRGRCADLVLDENRWRGGRQVPWHKRHERHKEKRSVAPPAQT